MFGREFLRDSDFSYSQFEKGGDDRHSLNTLLSFQHIPFLNPAHTVCQDPTASSHPDPQRGLYHLPKPHSEAYVVQLNPNQNAMMAVPKSSEGDSNQI